MPVTSADSPGVSVSPSISDKGRHSLPAAGPNPLLFARAVGWRQNQPLMLTHFPSSPLLPVSEAGHWVSPSVSGVLVQQESRFPVRFPVPQGLAKPQWTALPSNAGCAQKSSVQVACPGNDTVRESIAPVGQAIPGAIVGSGAGGPEPARLEVNFHNAVQKPFSTFKEIRNGFFTCGGAENCKQ